MRELLPKDVGDGQYVLMYSDYDVKRAKFNWVDIVTRLKAVTAIRDAIAAKSQGKVEDKRQK